LVSPILKIGFSSSLFFFVFLQKKVIFFLEKNGGRTEEEGKRDLSGESSLSSFLASLFSRLCCSSRRPWFESV